MDFDNFVWLVIGLFVGTIFGTVVTTLRNIEAKVEEVDELVKSDHDISTKDERGAFKLPSFVNIMAVAVVLIVALSAFQAQRAYKNSTDAINGQNDIIQDLKNTQADLTATQDRLERVVVCTQSYLSQALVALNNRTEFSGSQAQANVDLQKSQAELFAVISHQPPYTEARREEAVHQYVNDLNHFIDVATNTKIRVDNNPYPTDDEFSACLDKPVEKASVK